MERKKMKILHTLMIIVGALAFASAAHASPASDALLAKYKAAGVTKIDAAKAKADWTKEGKGEDGEAVSCSSCHGTDFSKAGKHRKTHKVIDAMSPRVTADRFTDEKKIEKWFKRNCNDAWGRECTVQEKADFLTFLLAQ
jgi:cytochrome c5